MTPLTRAGTLVVAATLAIAGCTRAAAPVSPPSSTAPTGPASSAVPAVGTSKVLLVAEENHGYDQIIGSPDAPYLNQLAGTFGVATRLDAGYPAACPSLAAYILLTSGSTAGICDDRGPAAHPLRNDNLFHQVATSGREWRDYAQSAPAPCALDNSGYGRYLVRHVPATYYLDERDDCARWSVPLGEPDNGALHDDVAADRLPAFGFVSPDACHDMHGAPPCPADRIATGDRWLRSWLPSILAGADYRAGRLAVIITWDEGTGTDNHIPTLVISPTTGHVAVDQAFTHCSTLRTTEELLGLPLLGCATDAPSMVPGFHLARTRG
jgi:phosphatidylinositol-3-phosphatase